MLGSVFSLRCFFCVCVLSFISICSVMLLMMLCDVWFCWCSSQSHLGSLLSLLYTLASVDSRDGKIVFIIMWMDDAVSRWDREREEVVFGCMWICVCLCVHVWLSLQLRLAFANAWYVDIIISQQRNTHYTHTQIAEHNHPPFVPLLLYVPMDALYSFPFVFCTTPLPFALLNDGFVEVADKLDLQQQKTQMFFNVFAIYTIGNN